MVYLELRIYGVAELRTRIGHASTVAMAASIIPATGTQQLPPVAARVQICLPAQLGCNSLF